MKQAIGFLFVLVMMLGIVACGQSDAEMQTSSETQSTEPSAVDATSNEPSDSGTDEPSIPKQAKILIAFFSATGSTKTLSEYAADILNADIYEIVPQQPYTDKDLAYYTDCWADKEQNDPAARPAISGSVENMKQYDTVLLGYPW